MNCELNLARPLANSISPVPISALLLYIYWCKTDSANWWKTIINFCNRDFQRQTTRHDPACIYTCLLLLSITSSLWLCSQTLIKKKCQLTLGFGKINYQDTGRSHYFAERNYRIQGVFPSHIHDFV